VVTSKRNSLVEILVTVNKELSSVVAGGILNVVDGEPISVIEDMAIEDATKTTSVEVTDESTVGVTIDKTGIVVRVGNADGTGDGGGLVAVGETDPCGMDVVAISKNTVLSTAIDAAITEWLISVLFDNISKDTIALGFNGKSTVSEGIGEDIENRGIVVTSKRNSLVEILVTVNKELSSVVAGGILNVVDGEPISVIEDMAIEDATKTTSVEVTDENKLEIVIALGFNGKTQLRSQLI
jgi:hypothetical protein